MTQWHNKKYGLQEIIRKCCNTRGYSLSHWEGYLNAQFKEKWNGAVQKEPTQAKHYVDQNIVEGDDFCEDIADQKNGVKC